MRRPATALAGCVAALLTVAGCGIAAGQPRDSYDAEQDARIVDCEPGDIGSVEAAVEITNRDDQERSYFVTARAVSGEGDEVAELHGAINAVDPGETVTIEAVGLGFAAPRQFECELVTVDSVVR